MTVTTDAAYRFRILTYLVLKPEPKTQHVLQKTNCDFHRTLFIVNVNPVASKLFLNLFSWNFKNCHFFFLGVIFWQLVVSIESYVWSMCLREHFWLRKPTGFWRATIPQSLTSEFKLKKIDSFRPLRLSVLFKSKEFILQILILLSIS